MVSGDNSGRRWQWNRRQKADLDRPSRLEHGRTFLHLLTAEQAFIEHAEFSGNFYGTSFMTVNTIQSQGRRCILDIEAQGVKQIKQTTLDAFYLFISPPSFSSLKTRLTGRGTETGAAVDKRLKTAIRELEYARREGVHDVVIVNEDGPDGLEKTYEKLKKVALGEWDVQLDGRGDGLPQEFMTEELSLEALLATN